MFLAYPDQKHRWPDFCANESISAPGWRESIVYEQPWVATPEWYDPQICSSSLIQRLRSFENNRLPVRRNTEVTGELVLQARDLGRLSAGEIVAKEIG